MATKLKQTRWDAFSKVFVSFQKLPYGCALALYRRRDGRRVRDDLVVKRLKVTSKNVMVIQDTERVTALLAAARKLLSTNIEARGHELAFLGPTGIRINGGCKLQTVRTMEPKESQADRDAAEIKAVMIEEVARNASWTLREAEHAIEEPDEIVPQGFLRALADRYGMGPIREAFNSLA